MKDIMFVHDFDISMRLLYTASAKCMYETFIDKIQNKKKLIS